MRFIPLLRCTKHFSVCHHRSPTAGTETVSALIILNNKSSQVSKTLSVRHFSADTYNNYLSPDVPPIGFAQTVMEKVHDVSGLPWWASIAVTTFTLRTVITLPLAVYSMNIMSRVEKLQPEIMSLSKRLKQEVAMAVKKFGWNERKARMEYNKTMKKLVQKLYVRDNCHPFKTTVVLWAQIPLWLCMSFALRNMSGSVPVVGHESPVLCPALLTEGALWFSDLTIPDVTWILPLTMGALNLANIEMHVLQRQNAGRFQRIVTNIMRGLIVIMVPIGASVPSSMCFYWTCSSLFGLGQNLMFKSPRVKSMLGIPRSASDSDTPYRDIINAAKIKYTFKKKKE